MNNIRYIAQGKRKYIVDTNLSTASMKNVLDKLPVDSTEIASVRVIKIEFEAKSDILQRQTSITVLGRKANIVASNSIGPDATVVVPETHFLRNGVPVEFYRAEADPGATTSQYEFAEKFPIYSTASNDVGAYIHVEVVLV